MLTTDWGQASKMQFTGYVINCEKMCLSPPLSPPTHTHTLASLSLGIQIHKCTLLCMQIIWTLVLHFRDLARSPASAAQPDWQEEESIHVWSAGIYFISTHRKNTVIFNLILFHTGTHWLPPTTMSDYQNTLQLLNVCFSHFACHLSFWTWESTYFSTNRSRVDWWLRLAARIVGEAFLRVLYVKRLLCTSGFGIWLGGIPAGLWTSQGPFGGSWRKKTSGQLCSTCDPDTGRREGVEGTKGWITGRCEKQVAPQPVNQNIS